MSILIKKSGIPIPGIPIPGITIPGIVIPGIPIPGITIPGITIPGITIPGITIPGIPIPGITIPGITIPGITIPGIIYFSTGIPLCFKYLYHVFNLHIPPPLKDVINGTLILSPANGFFYQNQIHREVTKLPDTDEA
jgi:hypothetical protein